MEQHDKELLEFDLILSGLALNCQALGNRQRLVEDFLHTGTGFAALKPGLEAYTAMVAFLHQALGYHPDCPGAEVPDLEELWDRLGKEGLVLELEELSLILGFLRHVHAMASWYRRVLEDQSEKESLARNESGRQGVAALVAALPLMKDLERELDFHIDHTGQLREDRIPELRAARKAIIDSQMEVRRSAASIIQGNLSLVSGDFATLRDGRMVIPLKTDFKGRIPGLIHQSSASGATLYVEPFEMVEKNNATSQAEARYHEEVQRILRRLSSLCSNRDRDLRQASHAFMELDLVMARARSGRQMNAFPCAGTSGVKLLDARHPLLGGKAVPISIEFPQGISMLVISGPNTGGKTVALKTLGLLALMRQAGMELPCIQGSSLPYFDRILADIGDEQSISQNLSTFSGHLVRIRSILELAGPGSLVLLDELGSGTDPSEGSALALAVSESLLDSGCTALVTSHHGAVKALAYAQDKVMNASMDFSEAEQRPTYRVIPGVPGQSHALDTAARLGLPPAVLDRARQLMSGRTDAVEELLQRLVKEELSQAEKARELTLKERILSQKEAGMAEREQALASQARELALDRSREESLFLSESRSKVERLLMELASWKKAAAASNSGRPQENRAIGPEGQEEGPGLDTSMDDARALMKELSSGFEHRRRSLEESKPARPNLPGFVPGQMVRLVSSGLEAELERENRDGTWDILVKGKRMRFGTEQFEAFGPGKQAKKKPPAPQYTVDSSLKASFTLDVRGFRALEARDAVIRQLDAACVQGMSGFSIIHGKGEGKLQVAIAELLKSSGAVEKFEFARPEDGGSGKTIVWLHH